MLYDDLLKDINVNIKERNNNNVLLLRYLNSCIQRKSMDERKDITDELMINVLKSEGKKLDEEIKLAKENNKEEMFLSKTKDRIVLDKYLPKLVSENEIKTFILSGGVDEVDFKNLGKMMKSVKVKFGVNVDLGVASKVIKEIIKFGKK